MSASKLARISDTCAKLMSHPLKLRPYRHIVFAWADQNDTPVYWVAGTSADPMAALAALKLAYETHQGTCFYCQKRAQLEVDHVVPIAGGGTDWIGNLVLCCGGPSGCNLAKHSAPLEQWNPVAYGRLERSKAAMLRAATTN